jgi:hypothetical protein
MLTEAVAADVQMALHAVRTEQRLAECVQNSARCRVSLETAPSRSMVRYRKLMGVLRAQRGCMRIPPSRRIVSPFSIGFSMMAFTR